MMVSRRDALVLSILAVVAIGARLVLIDSYGSPVPYWDQWDAEADRLYKPWLNGTLTLSNLFSAHNEHRILTTRLWLLGIFELGGGRWNPLLQMRCNTCLAAASIVSLVLCLGRGLRDRERLLLQGCGLLMSVVPYGWENTLWGFQSQIYLLVLASVWCLWLTGTQPPGSARWWVGVACGIAAWLSMAGGAITLAAAAMANGFSAICEREHRPRWIRSVIVLSCLAMASIALTPHVGRHDPMRPQSVAQFLRAVAALLGFPEAEDGFGARAIARMCIVNAPLAWWCARTLLRRGSGGVDRTEAFLWGLAMWHYGSVLAIALSRASAPFEPRYTDILMVGSLLNLTTLLRMTRPEAGWPTAPRLGVLVVWLASVESGFVVSAPERSTMLMVKEIENEEFIERTRYYIEHHDIRPLATKNRALLPYGSGQRLAELLDDPVIRGFLPDALMPKQ